MKLTVYKRSDGEYEFHIHENLRDPENCDMCRKERDEPREVNPKQELDELRNNSKGKSNGISR